MRHFLVLNSDDIRDMVNLYLEKRNLTLDQENPEHTAAQNNINACNAAQGVLGTVVFLNVPVKPKNTSQLIKANAIVLNE